MPLSAPARSISPRAPGLDRSTRTPLLYPYPMVPRAPHPRFVFAPLRATRDFLASQVLAHAEYRTADVDRVLENLHLATQPGFDLSKLSYHAWGDLAAIVGGQLGAVLLKGVKRHELHKEVQERYRRDDTPATRAHHDDVAAWAPALVAYLHDVVTGCAFMPDRRDPDSLCYERYTLIPMLRAYCGGGILGMRDAASWISTRPDVGKTSELEKLYAPMMRQEFTVKQDVYNCEPSWQVRRAWAPELTCAVAQTQAALLPPAQPQGPLLGPHQPALLPMFQEDWLHFVSPQVAPYSDDGIQASAPYVAGLAQTSVPPNDRTTETPAHALSSTAAPRDASARIMQAYWAMMQQPS